MYVVGDLISFTHAASDVAFVFAVRPSRCGRGARPASGSGRRARDAGRRRPLTCVQRAAAAATCRRASARVLATRRCVGAAGRATGSRRGTCPRPRPRTRRPWGPSHLRRRDVFHGCLYPMSPAGASGVGAGDVAGLSPRRAWRSPLAVLWGWCGRRHVGRAVGVARIDDAGRSGASAASWTPWALRVVAGHVKRGRVGRFAREGVEVD